MIRLLMIIACFKVAVVLAAVYFWSGGFDRSGQEPVKVAIAELTGRPEVWQGRSVTVTGTVAARFSVMGAGYLQLADAVDNAIAVAGLTAAPAPGETLTVTGVFHLGVAAGAWQLPVIMVR
ncbi:MAG: hypothetical protein ACOY2B_05250 [Pseudomonadota bacterium]